MSTASLVLIDHVVMVLINVFINVNLRCQVKNIFLSKIGSLVLHLNKFLLVLHYPDCHSPNVSYLITCSRCFLQYVGEIGQSISERFNCHKACLKNPKEYGFYLILSEHFHTGMCKNATHTIQILEKLDGNGRTPRGSLDASITKRKRMDIKATKDFHL